VVVDVLVSQHSLQETIFLHLAKHLFSERLEMVRVSYLFVFFLLLELFSL